MAGSVKLGPRLVGDRGGESMRFDPERIEKLGELFRETSEAHQEAFSDSDGADPEWPAWFAEQMGEALNELLGAQLDGERIAALLVEAEQEHLMTSPGREWPAYYAEFFIARAM